MQNSKNKKTGLPKMDIFDNPAVFSSKTRGFPPPPRERFGLSECPPPTPFNYILNIALNSIEIVCQSVFANLALHQNMTEFIPFSIVLISID
jgi:hypothetical protein